MTIHIVPFCGILFTSLITGCAHTALAQSSVFTPSELNMSASEHNGREVVVRGYVTLGPEAHSLYESEQLKLEFGRRWDSDKDFDPKDYVKYCLTIANPDFLLGKRDAISGKMVVVKGKFIDNYLNGRVDFGACPLPTAIVIDEADFKARYPAIFSSSNP